MGCAQRYVRPSPRRLWHKLVRLKRRGRHAASIGSTLLRACLRRDDRQVIARAWRTLQSLPALIDQHSLPQTLQRLDTQPLPTRPDLRDALSVTHLADAVVALDRRSVMGRCLRRSLVRFHLLRRLGLPVTIHVGVRPNSTPDTALVGHAWLTLDGYPWEEFSDDHGHFVVMFRYPHDQ